MEFVAIDVETANADVASICQVGMAKFVGGEVVDQWSSLVDPDDFFDPTNISIHGIDERAVRGQPLLPEVAPAIRDFLGGGITVCHTHFDRIALYRAFSRYELAPLSVLWLDSARVVRRTWTDFAWSGYGLGNICRHIGYEFRHHDALEDAKAAGHVLVAAIRTSQLDLAGWLRRVNQPIDAERPSGASVRRDGNPEGDLYGEVLVFTGSLSLPRQQAADAAAAVGCRVEAGVTKRTTILVVGDQDLFKLAGHQKSSKHRKAEELIANGQSIRIVRESDFQELVRVATGT